MVTKLIHSTKAIQVTFPRKQDLCEKATFSHFDKIFPRLCSKFQFRFENGKKDETKNRESMKLGDKSQD